MPSDWAIGIGLLAAAVVGVIVYGWLLFAPPREGLDILVLKLTAFAMVAGLLGVLAWVGYVLATTPPPKPIEEIERELEEELRRLERELEQQEDRENPRGGRGN